MIHQWSKNLPSKNGWAPKYCGFFYQSKEGVPYFFFEMGNFVYFDTPQAFHPQAICSADSLPLPEEWMLYSGSEAHYLLFNEKEGIDLTNCSHCRRIPYSAALFYIRQKKMKGKNPGDVLWEDSEFCIRMKGARSFVCESSGKKNWSFSVSAYFYTPFVRYQDHVFFGTAGNGGYFYLLSLKTGDIIRKIKTGGTISIVQEDGHVFFLANAPSAKMMEIDLQTGAVCQEVPLSGKNCYSPLQRLGDTLHTITFIHDKNDVLIQAMWHCVVLSKELHS